MEPVVLLVRFPVSHLGLECSDRVVFSPGESEPVVLWRPIQNVGAVLGAIADGHLEPMTYLPPLADLARAVGADVVPGVPPLPPPERFPRLRLLK